VWISDDLGSPHGQDKQLKRSGASTGDLVIYYTATIRSILEYTGHEWHSGIMKTQTENQQKRALKIVLSEKAYDKAMEEVVLDTLESRRDILCMKFFQDICKSDRKLHHFLPVTKTHRNKTSTSKQRTVPALNLYLP